MSQSVELCVSCGFAARLSQSVEVVGRAVHCRDRVDRFSSVGVCQRRDVDTKSVTRAITER